MTTMNAFGIATEETLTEERPGRGRRKSVLRVSLGNQQLSGDAGDAFLAEVANAKKESGWVTVGKCLLSICLYSIFGEFFSFRSRSLLRSAS
jgi:hypothetical protein